MAMLAAAVVPAAGLSSRFGGMKLVADVRGEPLLNRTLRALLDAHLDQVIVVVAPGASLEAATLLGHRMVVVVTNPDPARGMFSSIQAGLAVADRPILAVLPADMPFVRPDTVRATIDACERTGRVVVPVCAGRRGHPLALPVRHRAALLALPAAHSLKDALRALDGPFYELDVDDAGVLRDIDTREDLEGSLEL